MRRARVARNYALRASSRAMRERATVVPGPSKGAS